MIWYFYGDAARRLSVATQAPVGGFEQIEDRMAEETREIHCERCRGFGVVEYEIGGRSAFIGCSCARGITPTDDMTYMIRMLHRIVKWCQNIDRLSSRTAKRPAPPSSRRKPTRKG